MDELRNVGWQALTTEHASLALGTRGARRYPAEVVPFAALGANTREAMHDLAALLDAGEKIFLAWSEDAGPPPAVDEIALLSEIVALQMAPASDSIDGALDGAEIEPLTAAHGPEMVALTDLAFPGFFRPQTYRMGRYWGMRDEDGQLIAMGGERMALPGLREISAVCTHPEHTGHGYASKLIRHIQRQHRRDGLRSFLHVSDFNARAIGVYERLGFVRIGATRVTQIQRIG